METSYFTAWNWAGIFVQMIIGFMFGFGAPLLWMILNLFILLLFGFPVLLLILVGPSLIGAVLSSISLRGLSDPTMAILPDAPLRTEKDLRCARTSSFAACFVAGLGSTLSLNWWHA